MTENMIKWDQDADGILTLTMDDPDQGANTMNAKFQADFAATAERIVAEKDAIKGIILTSGKNTFFAGGDLGLLSQAQPEDAARIEAEVDVLAIEVGVHLILLGLLLLGSR